VDGPEVFGRFEPDTRPCPPLTGLSGSHPLWSRYLRPSPLRPMDVFRWGDAPAGAVATPTVDPPWTGDCRPLGAGQEGERHGVSGGSGLRGATRVRATGLAGRSGRFVGRRHERSHPSTDLDGLTLLGDAISTPSPLKCIYTFLSRNKRYFFCYRKTIPASIRTFDGYPRQTVRFRCRCLERPVPPPAGGFESRIFWPRSRRTFGSFSESAFRLFRVPRARSGV